MANISEIRTAIKAKLDTLSTPAVVYDTFVQKVEGHPSVEFEPSGLTSEYLDTCNNLRTYTFTLIVEQEVESISRDTALNILIGVFDEITNAFDNDFTLGGICEGGVSPVFGDFLVAQGANGDILYTSIKLECKTRYNIT